MTRAKVFISYSHQDDKWRERNAPRAQHLLGHFGVLCGRVFSEALRALELRGERAREALRRILERVDESILQTSAT